ncbi:hypothetical protein VTI28DRAFT_1458 [Corynascus sepedonium]
MYLSDCRTLEGFSSGYLLGSVVISFRRLARSKVSAAVNGPTIASYSCSAGPTPPLPQKLGQRRKPELVIFLLRNPHVGSSVESFSPVCTSLPTRYIAEASIQVLPKPWFPGPGPRSSKSERRDYFHERTSPQFTIVINASIQSMRILSSRSGYKSVNPRPQTLGSHPSHSSSTGRPRPTAPNSCFF